MKHAPPWQRYQPGQLLLAALVALGIALLCWLYLQSARVSAEQHLQYTQDLRDLREFNARLDGELLANQLKQVRNYDALTTYMHHLQQAALEAVQTPHYLDEEDSLQVAQAARQLQATLEQKAALLDRFKRNNSVLQNSLSYFPLAAADLLETHRGRARHAALQDAGSSYMLAVLAFAQGYGRGTGASIMEARSALLAVPAGQAASRQIDNLQRHGDLIVLYLTDTAALLHEVAELGTNAQLEELSRRYTVGNENASVRAGHFRTALFCVAVVLTAFLAGLFVHLESVRRSLARANLEINQRYQAQLLAEKQLSLHATAFRSGHDGITLTDAQGNIVDVNPAFSRITGWERSEVLGLNPSVLKSGKQDDAFYAAMWKSINESGSWKGEIWNRNKSGQIYPELLSISEVRDPQGVLTNYVAVFSDIGPIKKQESQLKKMAYYDALTELPNRVLLLDRLQQATAQTRRANTLMAVCYLDLDGFKPVNDVWGHECGDQVLVEMASRMAAAVRAGDTVARMGGDEFVVLLLGLGDAAECREAVTRLLDRIGMPLTMLPGAPRISASVGLTLFPQDDESPDTLLRHADQAMYRSKLGGKNMLSIFDAEEDRSSRSRHDRLTRVRQALDDGELRLFYQPKVDMRQGRVTGMEALLRWQHPERGLLGPLDFLPLVDNDDLIIDIGDWVIHTAMNQIAQWNAAGLDLQVSVNVAARQLQRADFTDKLRGLQAAYPNCLQHLELEILETTALEDIVKTARVIEECLALGVGSSLDDFGTGYSSLTYLRRLPVRTLKIDQSFVREILNDPSNLLIVQGVIGLAQAFQLQVIAEGVETEEHGRQLLQLNCDHAQGYGIARPMAARLVPDWIHQWRPPVAWRMPLL